MSRQRRKTQRPLRHIYLKEKVPLLRQSSLQKLLSNLLTLITVSLVKECGPEQRSVIFSNRSHRKRNISAAIGTKKILRTSYQEASITCFLFGTRSRSFDTCHVKGCQKAISSSSFLWCFAHAPHILFSFLSDNNNRNTLRFILATILSFPFASVSLCLLLLSVTTTYWS